jgi:SAM-dependent methyltransferase
MTNNDAMAAEWWSEEGGFFGEGYFRGDNSIHGHLPGRTETLEERTSREVEGVIRLLGISPGVRILDCPCGYGRHTRALVERGFRVDGVDINEAFLGQAAGGAGSYKAPNGDGNHAYTFYGFSRQSSTESISGYGTFSQLDMRMLQMPIFKEIYDAVINMHFSFGFFRDEEDNRAVMHGFANVLKGGGQLLIHTDVSPEMILEGKHYKMEETRELVDGSTLHITEHYDRVTRRLEGCWTIRKPDGREETLTPYSMRIYCAGEYTMMCKRWGLHDVKVYGSFEGKPFTHDSTEMIVVARK